MASTVSRTYPVTTGLFLQPHLHALIWFMCFSTTSVAAYICWDLNLVSVIYTADKSYLTSVIAVLVLFASFYAAWHIIHYSQQIEIAKQHLLPATKNNRQRSGPVEAFLSETSTLPGQPDQYDAILEIYADKLRSPVELGWFLVDLAVRLGLVGTIIGFILIFTSLSDTSIEGSEGLKELLVTMSGGMGTALFTTLCGLVGATALSMQFMVLGRQSEYLIGLLLRISKQTTTRLHPTDSPRRNH